MRLRISMTMVVAGLAGLAGGFLGSRAQAVPRAVVPNVIEAKSFVLLDDAGRKRGEWILERSGEPVLRLFDERGKVTWDSTNTPRMRPLSR